MNQQTKFDVAGAAPSPWRDADPSIAPANTVEVDPRTAFDEEEFAKAGRVGYPVVASQVVRRDVLGLAAGLAIALGLGFVTFTSLSSSRHQPVSPATIHTEAVPIAPPAPQPEPQEATPETSTMAVTAPVTPPAAVTQPMAPMGATSAPQSFTTPPIVVFDGGPSAPGNVADDAAAPTAAPPLLSGNSSRQGDGAAAAARSVKLAEPSMTVVQGTLIPAVLETAMDSDVPGFARAVVTQDVRSFDHSRVLIPRSSRLVGEYKAVSAQGQRRIYLMWTRLIRPDGVSIALASPATDAAGRSGVTGEVNSHFWARLGSALLTSVVGAANPFARGGATVVVAGGDSAANAAVQGVGQRAPTIRVQQGEPLRVFVARDLVFTPTDGDGQ